jgi:glycosyltransferase involved in cell wall biosynthesis
MIKDLISVIMPAYNASRFLTEAVESILNQSYKKIELIICDDCSTDGVTQNMIKEFASRDKRVKFLINEHNSGPFRTLQHCYEEAQGEYIIRVDSDDVLSDQSLEKMLMFMNQNNLDVVFSNVIHIDGEGNVFMQGIYKYFDEAVIIKDISHYRKMLGMRYISGILSKKEYLERINYSFFKSKELYYFESFFYDDSHVGFLPDAVYYYRIFGQNNSSLAKTVKNNKNDDNYFDDVPHFEKISNKTVRTYAEMLYLRARYPIAIFRSLNEGKEYSFRDEQKRLKKVTNYKFTKMLKTVPYFSKRNRSIGYCILLHLGWLARLIAKHKYKKAIRR